MEELGAGFFLAMHDLEIRGAGEVLGESQSGDIQEVGYSMYADMLNTAVKALKAGEEPDLDSPFALQCEVNLHTSALLPANYCPDVNARLGHYKALSHARTEDDLIHIHEELIDRYGLLPEAGENLLAVHRLRIKAEPLGIVKIDASEAQATIQFSSKPNVDAVSIIELVQKNKQVRLAGPDKLKVEITKGEEIKNRIQAVRNVLNSLRKEK
jgi:transcription-repair coupling factor (superfamily II helicase)